MICATCGHSEKDHKAPDSYVAAKNLTQAMGARAHTVIVTARTNCTGNGDRSPGVERTLGRSPRGERMSDPKNIAVCLIVAGYDCGGGRGWITPAELDAIAEVFRLGAQALREGKHGAISCVADGEYLAEVGIDNGGEFNDDTGLPVLQRVEVKA